METNRWELSVYEHELPPLLVCLGIGMLYAIREGIVPPKTGIWTLATPRMLGPLKDHPGIPHSVLDVFGQCDELSAISQLIPERLVPKIDALIQQLASALDAPDDIAWSTDWQVVPDRYDGFWS